MSNSDLEARLAQCKAGQHSLEKILACESTYGKEYSGEDIARWCEVCGSVVVDKDIDNRVSPGAIMKMKSPLIAKSKV